MPYVHRQQTFLGLARKLDFLQPPPHTDPRTHPKKRIKKRKEEERKKTVKAYKEVGIAQIKTKASVPIHCSNNIH